MKPLALVSGASRGIGRMIAQHLAQNGYDIIAVARDEQKLRALAVELREASDATVTCISADLDQFGVAAKKIKNVLEEFGRLDVLVHSAGIFRFGTGQMEMQDLQALLNTNVMAVHNINQIALPLLRMSPNPHLFAIASITGVEPFAMVGGYASSKHALVGYIRSIAQEESANGVRVTAICPDVVDTDMAAASGMPKSDMIRPDDIAKTIEFVMSLSPAVTLDQITIGCRPTAGSVRDAA